MLLPLLVHVTVEPTAIFSAVGWKRLSTTVAATLAAGAAGAGGGAAGGDGGGASVGTGVGATIGAATGGAGSITGWSSGPSAMGAPAVSSTTNDWATSTGASTE